MADIRLGDHTMTFEEALLASIEIQSLQFPVDSQPDIEGLKTWVITEGKEHRKIAKYWTIRSRHDNSKIHHKLVLETFRRTKKNGMVIDEEHSITLSDKDVDEIGALLDALASVSSMGKQGKHIIINTRNTNDAKLHQILKAISISGHKVDMLAEILSWADVEPRVTNGLIKLASEHPNRSKSLAAALNYGRYKHEIEELEKLIDNDEPERVYQKFLENAIWMFGSEYSELLPKRALALGIQLDFPLRRTVDGYLEIIEIKRPINDEVLFTKDASHSGLFLRNAKLTNAIDQAANYLRQLDAEQYRLEAKEGILSEKVRAKVVIGRDKNNPEIINALRLVNEQNLRVEVITYDQLLRIAKRILDILGDEVILENLEE
jgi:hypothetical protein